MLRERWDPVLGPCNARQVQPGPRSHRVSVINMLPRSAHDIPVIPAALELISGD